MRSRTIVRVVAMITALLALILIGLGAAFRPDRAIRVGTALVSETLCTEVFVAGLEPDRVFAEEIRPRPGMRPLLKRLSYTIDPGRRQVSAAWAGRFAMMATDRPGLGCALARSDSSGDLEALVQAPGVAANDPAAAVEMAVAAAQSPALVTALDHAFAEPDKPPLRQVRAIVVMRDGQIVAERYASGITAETPLLGYSVSKSLINALVGILVREHKLDLSAPAPVPAWRGVGDPRGVITLDQLLRMTAGLDLDESDSGFDPVSRMLFLEPDMAAFATGSRLRDTPGTRWNYTSGNTLIVSALLRDALGGKASDVQTFAERELFAPLGMRNVHLTFDAAGTPVGSTMFLASARDWARFGNLYLNDGVVDGKRILPSAWVKYSTLPTLASDYGAGFWVNVGAAENARRRVSSGMPADTFFASGNLGQRIVIIPSQRLVIVRMGVSVAPDFDIEGLEQLVVNVIKAGG